MTGLLEPLYQAAKKVPFESKVIGTDDTGVKVLVCADLADLWLRVANFAQGLLLNPGDYTVKIVPTTGSPVVQDVKLEANKTVLVK